MMSIHLQREIDSLKKKLLALSALVEEQLRRAVMSVQTRDDLLAGKVIDGDVEIDHREVEVEEDCLKILALHQPVAVDLRLIVAVLKINNDLERIGDLAVNIAERSAYLAERRECEVPAELSDMVEKAQLMLQNSLNALVNADPALAHKVCSDDDEVDDINRTIYEQIKADIRDGVNDLDSMIHLLGIARHIERIADLATNIAEDVIYMVDGEIVRHRTEDYRDGKR